MEPLLQRLDRDEIKMIMTKTKPMEVKKRTTIYTEGSQADYFYFIQQGEVRVFKEIRDNNEITITTRGPLDGLGENGIFSGLKYTNSAQATQDSMLYSIKRKDIEKLLERKGKLSLKFIRWVTESLEASEANLRDFLAFGSEGAVASIFIRYSNQYGVVTPRGIRITVPIMIRDIGNYIGITRETVSRIINKWKEQDLIENESKYFLIRDIKYFKKMLGCDKCAVENCVL